MLVGSSCGSSVLVGGSCGSSVLVGLVVVVVVLCWLV